MRRDALQKQGSKTPHKQEQTGKKNRGFRSKEYQGCEEDEEEGGAKDALEAKSVCISKTLFQIKIINQPFELELRRFGRRVRTYTSGWPSTLKAQSL